MAPEEWMFSVKVINGSKEDAQTIANELQQKYREKIVVSDIHLSKTIREPRSCYHAENSFPTHRIYLEYAASIVGLRAEMRKIVPSARINHAIQRLGAYRSGEPVPYSAFITLFTAPTEKQENINVFNQKITEIFGKFGITYKRIERK